MSGTSSIASQGPPGFGNHPAVSRAWLKRMVAILETRGQLSHVAWERALDEFRKLLLLPQAPSAFAPLHILSVAKKACDEDFEHFGDFIHQAEANPMLLVNRQRPVSAWSAQCMARMVGFEASHEDDSEWWMTSGMKVWIENLDDDVYFRIHYTRRRFLQAHELCYSLGDIEKGREVACKGLHHMKAFVHLHQNGRVLAQVGNHIGELQKLIRDKGLGGCLPSIYNNSVADQVHEPSEGDIASYNGVKTVEWGEGTRMMRYLVGHGKWTEIKALLPIARPSKIRENK